MFKALSKSFSDIFSKEVIGFILKTIFGAVLLMAVLFWLSWDSFSALISYLVSQIPYIGSLGFIQTGISVVIAPLFAYGIILILISILTSIFSPKLLIKLAKKHYGIDGKDNSKISEVLKVNIKASLIFLTLFLITLPLQFVPILGQIVMLFLWAILLKEPTIYDVKSLFNIQKQSNIWPIALISAAFNFIPFLNLFAPIFAQIMFMHYLLQPK